jgi:hypothetical protein
MHRYTTYNGAMPTTAPIAGVATGTSTKTMLQIATPATRQLQVITWGYSLSILPGAVGSVELIQSNVASTAGTAHIASGANTSIYSLDPNAPASLMTVGTGATGYTFGTLGTPTATRVLDLQQIPITAGEATLNDPYQFVLDERPIVAASAFLQVRATMPTSGVNLVCWITWDE